MEEYVDVWSTDVDIPKQVRAQRGSDSRKVKLTSKSFTSLIQAVNKRQQAKIAKLNEQREQLMKDYNASYTNLTDASNTAVDNKEVTIDSFEGNIDELYKLKVKIINIESKLNGLNNRLSVDTRKIKKANMHFGTLERIVNAAKTRLEANRTKNELKDNLNDMFEDKKYISAAKSLESIKSPYDFYKPIERTENDNVKEDDSGKYDENPVEVSIADPIKDPEFYTLFKQIVDDGDNIIKKGTSSDIKAGNVAPVEKKETVSDDPKNFTTTINQTISSADSTAKSNNEKLDNLLNLLGSYGATDTVKEKTPIVPPTPVVVDYDDVNENVKPVIKDNANDISVKTDVKEPAPGVKVVPVLRKETIAALDEMGGQVVKETPKVEKPQKILNVTAKLANPVMTPYDYVKKLVISYSEAYDTPDYDKIKSVVLNNYPDLDDNTFAAYFGRACGEMFNIEREHGSRKI